MVGPYTLTLSGAIGNSGTGSGTLVKIDSGTLVLTNDGNTYSGGTIITAGILNINSDAHAGGHDRQPQYHFQRQRRQRRRHAAIRHRL